MNAYEVEAGIRCNLQVKLWSVPEPWVWGTTIKTLYKSTSFIFSSLPFSRYSRSIGQNLGPEFQIWRSCPKRREDLSWTDVYHYAKFHADWYNWSVTGRRSKKQPIYRSLLKYGGAGRGGARGRRGKEGVGATVAPMWEVWIRLSRCRSSSAPSQHRTANSTAGETEQNDMTTDWASRCTVVQQTMRRYIQQFS